VAAAETSGQVKRRRKSQLCDDHHRFENGARFEGLLRFAAVTSGWPTTRPNRGATMNLKQAGLDFLEGNFSTHDRRKKTRAAYAIDLKQFLGFPNWTAFLEQQ
jgi:hypothetical protein